MLFRLSKPKTRLYWLILGIIRKNNPFEKTKITAAGPVEKFKINKPICRYFTSGIRDNYGSGKWLIGYIGLDTCLTHFR